MTTLTDPADLTAFCATCPAPEEVSRTLQALGFALTFQMDTQTSDPYQQLAPLAAQFHYADGFGTEVIYLAGRDFPSLGDDDDDESEEERSVFYPVHASRFWLCPGAHPLSIRRVKSTLSTQYHLTWLDHVLAQVEAA